MNTHVTGRARRTAPSLRSAHRVFSIFTLMFLVLSMMSPLMTPATFAQEATPAVGGEQTVEVQPAAEQPAAPVEEPVAPVVEEPAAPVVEEPVAPVVEEPAAPVVEEPVAPVVEEPVAPVVEEPVAPVVEEPAAPVVEEPVAPVVEEPVAPVVEEPAAPVVEEPVAPVVEEPVAPVIDEPVAPVVEEPAEVVVVEPVAPVVEEPAADAPADETIPLETVVNTNEVIVADTTAVSCVASNTAAPTIGSDLADYAPGSLVTLTGGGWASGQEVRIAVDDDNIDGRVWSHNGTAYADEAGAFTYTFYIADWFVLDYTVVATGECTTATTAFTDAQIVTSATVNGGNATVEVAPGATFTVEVNVTTNGSGSNANWGSTSYRIAGTAGALTCLTAPNPDFSGPGNYSSIFTLTAPSTVGTYNLYIQAASHTANCGSSTSNVLALTGAVSVKNNQTITFGGLGGKTFGDAAFDISAIASSSLPVAFSTQTPLVCTVSGITVTIVGAGACTIRASQPGNATHFAALNVDQSFQVAPRAITVTADARTKAYGDADPVLSYTITSGSLVNGDAISGALSRDPGETVGSYNILQGTLALDGNYVLTFVGAQLTITPQPVILTVEDLTVEYDGTGKSVTVDGMPEDGNVTITYDGNSELPVNVGTYDVVATMSGNYSGSAEGTLTITPRTIETIGETYMKVYGDADPTFNGVATGVIEGDDITISYARVNKSENVGDYWIAAMLGGSDAGNYVIRDQAGILYISPRVITVTADSQTKVFGTADPELTYDITSGTLVAGDGFTGALTRVTGSDVGSYDILLGNLALSPNYHLIYTNAQLTITPQPVALTVEDLTVEYDGAAHGATVNGAPEDGIVVVTYNGSEDLPVNAGTYTVVATLSGNYSGSATGTLTITPIEITVTAVAKTKVYGEVDPALTFIPTTGSLVDGDGFTGALTRSEGEDVGSYYILQGSLALSSNYDLTFVGAQLTITAQPVDLTVEDLTVEYNGNTHEATVNGAPEDGIVVVTYNGNEDLPVNAGTYTVVVTMTGNYSGSAEGTLTITPRSITVTADAQTKVFGAADPELTHSITSGTLVEGDSFAGTLSRIPGEGVASYGILQGSLALSSNYHLTFVGARLTITAQPVELTVEDLTVEYDGAAHGATVSGAPEDGIVVVTYNGNEDLPVNAGTYTVVVTMTGNYSGSAEGTLTITPMEITVTADAQTINVGDTSVLTFASTPTLVSGDSFTGALELDRTLAGAGTYNIVKGTLALSSNYTLKFNSAVLTVVAPAQTLCVSEIQSPFKMGTKNVVKYGSVVPVKVRVTDCLTGAPVIDAAPTIQVFLISSSAPDGTAINILSSSSADSGNTLRHTGDGYYIFNLSTKSTSFSDATATYKIVVTVDGKPVEGTIGLKK